MWDWGRKRYVPAPHVARLLTSALTMGSETRALIIERVLIPIAAIITPMHSPN